jgi:hypothetical protein
MDSVAFRKTLEFVEYRNQVHHDRILSCSPVARDGEGCLLGDGARYV